MCIHRLLLYVITMAIIIMVHQSFCNLVVVVVVIIFMLQVFTGVTVIFYYCIDY